MAAGRHQIPFSFALPAQIPSSFEGTDGRVRYKIKASLLKDRFIQLDYEQVIILQVNTVADLNNLATAV